MIVLNDEDDFAEITTHQRTWVTRLSKNPSAEDLEDLTYGSTVGGRYRIPASLISLRSKVVKLSEQERAKRARRLDYTR